MTFSAEMIVSVFLMAVVMVVSMAVMIKPLLKPDSQASTPSPKNKSQNDNKLEANNLGANKLGANKLGTGMVMVSIIISLGLYAAYGSFGLPDQPLSNRQSELAEAAMTAEERKQEGQSALQTARAAAEANPDDIEAQFNLADAAAVAGDSETEISTLKAILRQTKNPLLKAMIGEALTREAGGIVTTRALAWIDDGLSEAPDDWRGRYLKGLYQSQSGDDLGALEIWSPLADDLNGSEIFPAVAVAINEAANRLGMNPEDFLPQPLAEQQSINAADITAMVEGLEAELTSVTDNRDRWVMLVRSLTNLGEETRRDAAILRYLETMPAGIEDVPVLLSFVELLLPLEALPAEMPEILTPLLDAARGIDANNHGILFFSGLVARSHGDRQSLEAYWGKLLSKLDPENPLYTLLKQEMAKIN